MSKRRGNREGSVYQRADGRWTGAITIGGGRTRQIRKQVYGRTREEVAGKLQELQHQAKTGTLPKDGRITVTQFADQWLEEKRLTVRPSTLRDYDLALRVHILPSFGSRKLTSITTSDVQGWYAGLSAGGLKPISVRDYSSRFSAMLARAVELDLLVKNPCSAAKLPRIPRRDLPILTGPEMRVLLKAAAGDRLEALLVVALTTGIRQGETLALQWDRVDLDEGVLSITKTLKAVPGDGFTLVEPKTSSAVRKVVLAPMAVDALRRHRIRQSEEALALGKAWDNQYRLVFSNEVGGFISQSNLVSRHFKKWLATAGLPRTVRWHDLRHTAASILLSKGVPVPTVSQMLGHADPSITLKTYSWAVPGDQALAATAMESLLAG